MGSQTKKEEKDHLGQTMSEKEIRLKEVACLTCHGFFYVLESVKPKYCCWCGLIFKSVMKGVPS
jgi:hypothetical protein